jgi:hypothetical protein
MPKICPLYKMAQSYKYGVAVSEPDVMQVILCDRAKCQLWIPSEIDPGKYGHCGLKR